jgi:putative aldouronate transport system permease protein
MRKSDTGVAVVNYSKKKPQKFEVLKSQLQLQSMVWPALIFVFIFSYIPMGGNIIAFKNYNVMRGFLDSPWAGLKYFKEFFVDPNFMNVLKNTLGINILGFIIGFPAPIIFALFLNELNLPKFKKFVQTVSYLPYFVSWAVFGGLIVTVLSPTSGVLNALLIKISVISESINFLGEADNFWIIMVIANLIKGIGWGSIIYIAAISGVDQEIYESATIDGAGRFQKMWNITLPGIATTVSIMMIFSISGILNTGYEQLIVLQNPLNLVRSETIDTYVYKVGIQQMRYSYATAVGFVKALVAVILLLGANYSSKKITENSLF